MNKTLKKVLIFILALIAVVLVIFLIELLVPRQSGGPDLTSPAVSDSPSPTPSESASPSPSLSPSPSPSEDGAVTTEETADGTKYNVTIPEASASYSITADSALFTHSRENGSDLFKSNKDESEYLRIDFVKGAKAAALAPSIMDSYINYTNFEQSGQNYIDGTQISGETVTADDGKTQVTAWLVDTDKGVLTVAISLSLSDKASQTPQLDKLLSSLTINE
ncbi:hypothetical protein SAMN02745823_01394 [Sporobacter termitidis DSM 10068]|uniref:Uncharacterized protein n=1 Tax=Sporobacter termitidis DSM 10068 TaxID=1123282 RepID=A0A1M5WUU9_9FIRM|nr:hypothetical protein [Sporobacter termitidis]SHH91230.1 hypothetical protein SAMN02745823_01394 [Sporobacter termitidis DSM 10068]